MEDAMIDSDEKEVWNPTGVEYWTVAARYEWAEPEGEGGVAASISRGEAARWIQISGPRDDGKIVTLGQMGGTEGTFRAAGEFGEEKPSWSEITDELLTASCEGGGKPEQIDFGVAAERMESECRVLWSVFEPCQVAVIHSRACISRQAADRGWPWMQPRLPQAAVLW
jgi:hypothetical protein